jgi:succinate dehydrogenase / fumarate reductase flavoprotein subunit
MRGGVWVDFETGESPRIKGLYAAGSAAGRDGQTNCMYDGKCAAEAAVDQAASSRPAELPDAVVGAEERRLTALFEPASPNGETLVPNAVKQRIRQTMWAGMDYVKTADRMRWALDEIRRIRSEDVPRMASVSPTTRFNYDVVDALDAGCMLDACELQIASSLARQESRGPFFREDFPYQDNREWIKYIVVSRAADDVSVRSEPVNLDGLPPIPRIEDPFPHLEDMHDRAVNADREGIDGDRA